MLKRMLAILLAIVATFMISSCEDTSPIPILTTSSIRSDGTGFTDNDSPTSYSTLRSTYYLSDDLIFLLSDKLSRKSLSSYGETVLTPVGMELTDKEYLAIDKANEVLYFGANDAIYKVGFDGQGLVRLSQNDGNKYYAPALSACGRYLTAANDTCIARFDIEQYQWNYVNVPFGSLYGIYAADENAYYYYSNHISPTNNNDYVKLIRLDAATLASNEMMSMIDYKPFFQTHRRQLEISNNCRYFGMQHVIEPYQEITWWGSNPWQRFSSDLQVFDRVAARVIVIPSSFTFAFIPDSDEMLYSHLMYGMADLMRMDLTNSESTMIWDGFYQTNIYSYSVSRLIPRYDGRKVYIHGWKRARA